jgi:hypothetical protein
MLAWAGGTLRQGAEAYWGESGAPDDVCGGLGSVLAGSAAGPDREIGGAKSGARNRGRRVGRNRYTGE